MDRKAIKQLDRLDKKLVELISMVSAMTVEERSQNPAPGAWSVLEVMEHLRRAEALSGEYLRKKAMSAKPLSKKSIRSTLREAVLGWYLNAPIKFKAPAIVNEESFPGHLELDGQADEWRRERAQLRSWLSGQPADYFKRQGYRHPLAGRMTVNGMLKFFEWHFDRHRKQIDRTIKKVKGQ